MPVLTIGRVGLNVVDLDHPSSWTIERSFDNANLMLSGWIHADTVANAKYLRGELIAQQGVMVAVTYSLDPDLDGFYILRTVSMETVPNSYRIGYWSFECDLFWLGNHASAEIQSVLTVGNIFNDFSTDPFPWHAIPVNALAYNAGPTGNPLQRTRESAEGNVPMFEDISFTEDPTWSVAPSSYYLGGAKVFTGGMLRAGLVIPENDPTDWYISNALVEVRAVTYQSTSTGRIELRFYDGSAWGSWVPFYLRFDDTATLPRWDFMTIIRNSPECVTVRLTLDNSPNNARYYTLDISLRRGSHYASFLWTFTIAHAATVERNSADASTRPGGTASYIYDSDTIDGDKWILGCPLAFTMDGTQGGITINVEAETMPFFIGFLKAGSTTNDTGDGPEDLAKQYTGWVSESVRAIRR